MQVYQYKLDVDGARYEVVKNGFKFERNGCTFTEVMNRETKKSYILAELNDGKGGKKYDIMSLENWEVIRHNADPIAAMVKAFGEGKKARVEASLADLKKQVVTLKGAGLIPSAIQAALTAQGYAKSDVETALKG